MNPLHMRYIILSFLLFQEEKFAVYGIGKIYQIIKKCSQLLRMVIVFDR